MPFLAGLPDDLRFVLALHEGSVLGLATGYALGRREPALVLVHTTAGLGNSVAGIATARVNRAPLVIIVGQQDRRHLVFEPFLTGRLSGLAGEYPVWFEQPVRAQDVPGAIDRAYHEAATARGPAIVVVPMDDWLQEAELEREDASAGRVLRASAVDDAAVDELATFLESGRSPALVVGAGADEPEAWEALVELAERLVAPVFQESFGARAGFPQDHRLFAGFLPADRPRLRERLAPYDAVLILGAGAFRQSPWTPGRFTEDGHARRGRQRRPGRGAPKPGRARGARAARGRGSSARRPAAAAERRAAAAVPAAAASRPARAGRAADRKPRAGRARGAPAARTPSSSRRLPSTGPRSTTGSSRAVRSASSARRWAASASACPPRPGCAWRFPSRPVVAVIGDGSSLYGIQGLWSAAHYGAGVLYVILSNGGYAIMDRLAERSGSDGPWPGFGEIEIAALARGFGCPAQRVTTHDELLAALDEAIPTLAEREEPLLLDVVIAPTTTLPRKTEGGRRWGRPPSLQGVGRAT